MNTLFDASVLIPAMVDQLTNHHRCFTTFAEYSSSPHKGFCSAHTLAECYSVLTTLPLRRRISPQDAQQLIHENLSERLTVVSLRPKDYIKALDRVSEGHGMGTTVYDVLNLIAAERSDCERIFTFNGSALQNLDHGLQEVTAP
jgi:predicted nucleic acid-binding protein